MKFLDLNGLTTLWANIKKTFVAKESGKGLSTNDYTTAEKQKLAGIASNAEANVITAVKVNGTALTPSSKAVNIDLSGYAAKSHSHTKSDIGLSNVTNDAQVKRSEMGTASGVATLGTDGKVPSSQLPSYVDDVLEFDAKTKFPTTGETGKIYVDTTTNLTYRWSGSAYVEISQSIALGETSSTAYAGNKGKANADSIAKIINGTQVVAKATTANNVGGFTVAKNVPADAVFTDTHHTAKEIVGSSATATANVTAETTNPFLNVVENGTVRSSHQISGGGATTVKADKNGNIVITSANSTYDLSGYVKTSDLVALTNEEINAICV
nr:MAG TPA: Peptidase [Bacteriophage sp.]